MAVNVRDEPVAVAAALMIKVVELVIDATKALAGMPAPEMPMPGNNAAVLVVVTVVLAFVVALPLSEMTPPVMTSPDPVAVAPPLMTKVVGLVIEATVVPAVMPVPEIDMPASNDHVLLQVTVGLPSVVAQPVTDVVPAAVNVREDPLAVALALITAAVPLVIELITVPAGMLVPAIVMPVARPTVLVMVMLALALVVAPPVKVLRTRCAVNGTEAIDDPIAGLLMTKVVPFVTEITVVPGGILVPVTTMPAPISAVLSQVTVVLPKVVTQLVKATLPAATSDKPEPVAVAFALIKNEVLLMICMTVAFTGMLGPVTSMPS